MSDSEEEIFGFYGKPLEQYDEDAIPKKRPISVEDQIATDAQGRRRFHGAFTGGFSAGFYNSVGSLEGWKPSEFKSSRSEKTAGKVRKPEDYMDDEDIGEFGIAPQIVKATEDFNTSKKRKRKTFPDGPIPGEPVLQTLIEKNTETIGYILLRNMGLRHASDNNAENDTIVNDDEDMAPKKVYGCEMPKPQEIKITFETLKINEIYEQALKSPKINTFGMGYKGLDKGNINLFQSAKLVVQDRNKKFSVSGQAFGVGAFEEEDEDIYVREDLSKYDFELTSEKQAIPKKIETNLFLKLFIPSKNTLSLPKQFLPPTIPHSFSGKHKVKKSRFEPIEPTVEPKRNEIDASTRSEALGESTRDTTYTPSKQLNKMDNLQNSKNSSNKQIKETKFIKSDSEATLNSTNILIDKFVSASTSGEHLDILEPVRLLGTTHGSKDMKEAARMKMFGPLTRISDTWLPNSLLYKRFNVPEPGYNESEMKPRTKSKPLIFESEKFPSEILNNLTTPGIEIKKTNNEIAPEPMAVNQETTIEKEVEQSEPQEVAEVSRATIDITEKIDVSKNIDLFKAVFLDSDSESEMDDDKEEDISKIEEDSQRAESIKSKVLSEELFIPKIKPFKEGILSNVKFNPNFKTGVNVDDTDKVVAEEQEIECENDKDPNTFGPKLPDKIINIATTTAIRTEKQNDEWIEKCDLTKIKEHKHKSKRKKEKHKKKHKHRK